MRILAVEDEPRLLRSLAKALREEGYAVDTADAGDDGLYKAENSDYDAVVLDVMLPRLDGWEVLDRLRKKKANARPHAHRARCPARPRSWTRHRRG